MKHFVIPDPHAHPDHDNKRFTTLGKAVIDIKPDVIICIGDWFDMPSLCSYDRGTRGFEGRRYKKDIAAGIDALEKFVKPIRDYNAQQRHNRKAQYKPRMVFLHGNHEYRIVKATQTDPVLDGTIGLADLQIEKYFDEVYDFLEIVSIDGIAYSHYFTSGVMGRAIGGEHAGYSLLTKKFQSCTMGHTHTFDHSTRTRADGTRLHGLVCGVYQDYVSEWAGPANELWWSGVVIKNNVKNGDYDIETISIETLTQRYGS
jgi:hypothetical protein